MEALKKLFEREARLKKRIRELQSREKRDQRKQRTARLIRFGIAVDACMRTGEIVEKEWRDVCRKVLSERDFQIAFPTSPASSLDEAHLNVSQPTAEKQCAPAAGESQSGAIAHEHISPHD
jgi:hypothetical protein